MVRRVMTRASMDEMLVRFLGNIVYTVLLLAVVMAALDHLGIQTTSLLAVFGAAGLAIGLALKDSLGNFSSGVMLILFRPFKVGDFIEAGGETEAKRAGKQRLEMKGYVMQEYDLVNFRFNK